MTKPHLQAPVRIDPVDLEGRCAQLASLTVLLYGRGRESFNDLFEYDRDNILWLVSDLAAEIRDMVKGGQV